MELLKYEEYSLRVTEIYTDLSSTLSKLIPYARIDHIGSSAIPGSISKGDLDVLVAVELSEFNDTLEVIESIGFTEKEDTLRTDELCMLTTDEYNYDVAIQLIVKGSEFESFITFRDLLSMDKSLLITYNKLKEKLNSSSEICYREAKDNFITNILNQDKELHQFIIDSEIKIQSCISSSASSKLVIPHWTMWKDIDEDTTQSESLQLTEVLTNNHWDNIFEIRKKVEASFGITNSEEVKSMINDVRSINSKVESNWYLVSKNDEFIGEFGLVYFSYNKNKIGRIQDIDIIPSVQNEGNGNLLLNTIFLKAKSLKLSSLCLMALETDWKKNWYISRGFKKVGKVGSI